MELKLLQNKWDEALASAMAEPERLTYRSNLLGSDLRLTNFGGGNTSAKVTSKDPVTGEDVEVLWVKGSGGDLGSIKLDGFATLYLDRLLALKGQYKGVEQEDAMADLYSLCTFNANPRAASIDTPLHGFLPMRHVDHLHPDWAISIAASANGKAQLVEIEKEFGVRLAWLPWKRPGFELGVWLSKAYEVDPTIDGIILGSHGIFTWGNTAKESYENTLRVLDAIGQYVLRATTAKGDAIFGGSVGTSFNNRREIATKLIPILRGKLGGGIAKFSDSEDVLTFVNSADLDRLAHQGTSCPDHFVRTKVRPMVLRLSGDGKDVPDDIQIALEAYQADYRSYYETNRQPDSPAIRSTNPTVVLIPGIGMISFGKNSQEARITGEFYINAIHVMEGATAMEGLPADSTLPAGMIVNNYVALEPKEAFGIEYWKLEEAKLQRMPAEKELSRKVALLVGASPGIGFQVASRLLENGAHLVVADVNIELADELAIKLREKFGKESVASTKINITDRESVQNALDDVIHQYGGLDILVNTAAVFIPPTPEGKLTDEQWKKTLEINILGSYILAEVTSELVKAQGTDASYVFVSSANAVVAKKGSVAYDISKTAVNHMVRELAIELSPYVRINAVAPATVVEGSQMFPRDRVIASLSKYAIMFDDSESDDELRTKLSQFYAKRTLLHLAVTPTKVSEAIYWLASPKSAQTTGHVVPVDGGLTEAFLR